MRSPINLKFAIAYNNRGLLRYAVKEYRSAIADWQTAAQLYRQQNNTEAYQKIQEGLSILQTSPK